MRAVRCALQLAQAKETIVHKTSEVKDEAVHIATDAGHWTKEKARAPLLRPPGIGPSCVSGAGGGVGWCCVSNLRLCQI